MTAAVQGAARRVAPSAPRSTAPRGTTPRVLHALALAAFGIGTTEFVVVGLLPRLSATFQVSTSTAGLLVTGYAAGVAIGGPLLTLATRRLAPRTTLVGLMAGFAVGHAAMALAPDFPTLLIARLLTASAHGAFFGLGAVVAGTVVEPARRGRAIALMFTGLSLATVIGVPGGTVLGQRFGWQAPFVAVALLSALAGAALHRTLPTRIHQDTGAPARPAAGTSPAADRRGLARALATTVIGWGAMFIPFTFLTPYLEEVTGFGQNTVTALLLLFGTAAAVGGLLGGRASDRFPRAVLPATLTALAVVLAGTWAAGTVKPLMVVLLAAWGVAGFALIPPLQAGVVRHAGPDGTLASTLNIAAFNIGISGASAIGEVLVGAGLLRLTPLIGAAGTLAAVALAGARTQPHTETRRRR